MYHASGGIAKWSPDYYIEAFPLGSYGRSRVSSPAKMIRAPAMYTGTAVARLAYNAMIGA
jgi:hypothetical protein